jgi:hypothetical protein
MKGSTPNVNKIDCSICLGELEDAKSVHCYNCPSAICEECMVRFMEYCYKANDIPRCAGCKIEILHKQVPRNLLKQYNKVCTQYLLNEVDIKLLLLKQANQDEFLEKLKKEKLEFVASNFPVAISKVIELALSKKMKKVNRTNSKYMDNISKQYHKKCMNIVCTKGMLYSKGNDLECNLCNNLFCGKCEIKKSHIGEHTCKNEDLESIKLRESFVKCPKCRLPVSKSEGCNNITCSICKTNFCYISGDIVMSGNHTDTSLTLKKDQEYKLSRLLVQYYPNNIIELLRQIEKCEPKHVSIDPIISSLKKIKGEFSENSDLLSLISKKYCQYVLDKANYIPYFSALVQIQSFHDDISNRTKVNELEKMLKLILERLRKNNNVSQRNVISSTDILYKDIQDKIKETYPHASILWMEDVTNPERLKQFEAQDMHKYTVKRLFHGTTEHNIDSIIKNGLQVKYNKTSAFGKGTYLSSTCDYSMNYTDKQNDFSFMFVCDCLIGKYGIDYTGNNSNIYCFPSDFQVLPRVLVVFRGGKK